MEDGLDQHPHERRHDEVVQHDGHGDAASLVLGLVDPRQKHDPRAELGQGQVKQRLLGAGLSQLSEMNENE